MQEAFLVFLGAGIGGALRHGVNLGCAKLCGTTYPWGTFTVNVLGSLVMGVVAGWLSLRAEQAWAQPLRLFLATGILGGFTTFSAFSLDAMLLWERGESAVAAGYAVASVACSIAALAIGTVAARALG